MLSAPPCGASIPGRRCRMASYRLLYDVACSSAAVITSGFRRAADCAGVVDEVEPVDPPLAQPTLASARARKRGGNRMWGLGEGGQSGYREMSSSTPPGLPDPNRCIACAGLR